MTFLDTRTVVFIGVIIDVICTFVIVLLWRQSRTRFSGTIFWVADFSFQTVSLILIVLRDGISPWISIVLANVFVIAGAILGFIGFERFTEKKGPQIQNVFLLIVFTGVHTYFTFVHPSMTVRNLNLSLGLLIICFQCMWLLLRKADPDQRPATRAAGIVFMGYCVVNLIRVGEIFIVPQQNDFFHSEPINILFVISYLMLFIMLTFSLSLMVNMRLMQDIRIQEEKFSKAFHSSPYAVMLTRFADGKIFEANMGFQEITGYSLEEVIGKKTFDLHLWENEEDRKAVVDELSKRGKVHGIELTFRKKSGEKITGLFSAEIITIHNEKAILSSIGDITKRKQDEENIQKLLTEKQILLKEVHHRIKNNMSIMMSLLTLQSKNTDNPSVAEMLQAARNRLMSMFHLYDKLYRTDDFKEMSLNTFLPPLVDEIVGIFPVSTSVTTRLNIEDIRLDAKILSPLGILINELITNSMKYAFAGRDQGLITISAAKKNHHITVIFEDDGVGIPETVTVENAEGFGMKLVGMLTEQIYGTIRIERQQGTRIIIEFDK